MPCTSQAIDILRKSKVLVAPAKAASAGGVMDSFTCLIWVHLLSFGYAKNIYSYVCLCS